MPLDKFPPLNCKAHLPAWIARVEKDLKAGGIPRSQWADTAILFLAGYEPLNKLMRQVQARRKEAGRFAGLNMWTWKDFKESLSQVLEERENRTAIQKIREDHPKIATAAAASLIAVGSVALAPAILVGGLSALGFTASGVAAGSIAAGLQSIVYGGATTGLFSVCQSLGATMVVGSGSVISGIGSLAAGAAILPSSSPKPETGDSDSESDSESEGSDAGGSRNTSLAPPP